MNHLLYIKRKENKLYQKEVAKKIGIHEQTYSRKEKGQLEFTITEGRMLAKIFDCTLDDLFGGDHHIKKTS